MPKALALDFAVLVNGTWVYKDPLQVQILKHMAKELQWDQVAFDVWLYGHEHWHSFPKIRQRLIALREQLLMHWGSAADTPAVREQCIREYLRETRQLSVRLQNMPPALKAALTAVQTFGVHKSSKLDPKSVLRIQRLYREMVLSGQKYGARTKLATQYGVSLATVRKALQSA
jgi:hypothetical protein